MIETATVHNHELGPRSLADLHQLPQDHIGPVPAAWFVEMIVLLLVQARQIGGVARLLLQLASQRGPLQHLQTPPAARRLTFILNDCTQHIILLAI